MNYKGRGNRSREMLQFQKINLKFKIPTENNLSKTSERSPGALNRTVKFNWIGTIQSV